MTTQTAKKKKAHYYKTGCRCGSKIMSKSFLTDAMLADAGWEKKNGSWLCDDCAWGQT